VGGYRPIGQLVGMGQRPWDPRRTSTGWPRDRSASLIADVKRRRVQACCRPTEPADAVCQVRSSHSSAFPRSHRQWLRLGFPVGETDD